MKFDRDVMLNLIENGEIEPEGRIAWGSNYTMLARTCAGDHEGMVVYKPRRGERPLWDFPSGTLSNRERAAWLVSDQLGWGIVPPTVLREGPHGVGSVQFFIDHDPNVHYFNIEGDPQHQEQLQQITLFDLLTNNADRKAGHVLVGEDGRLWAIDHGICFHSDYKLRTVIWEFQGRPIPAAMLVALTTFGEWMSGLDDSAELLTLLSPLEITALYTRVDQLIRLGIFPEPREGRHYPWPPI